MPWSTTRAKSTSHASLGVKCELILKGLRLYYGVERHLCVNFTNEDRVVCIHSYPCKRLSRDERDHIQRFKSSVWETRVDDEALVSILFQDGEDYGPSFEL